jgi:hypothetical protein
MNITVQTKPITEPGGVQDGKLTVLYQFIPPLVSQLPIAAVRIVMTGIIM